MSLANRNRRARVRDFLQRARFSPIEVESYGRWQYIRVHPLADEPDVLSRNGISPADCFSADAWLYTGDDVLLLQIWSLTKTERTNRTPCCVATWSGEPPYLQIHARLSESQITSSVLETVMAAIAKAGVPGRHFCRGRHSRRMRLCKL